MNTQDARQFIELLYDADDLIEVRILGGPKPAFRNWHRAKHLSLPVIEQYGKDQAGRNYYLGANPRRGRGGTANDVGLARCLFVDWDGIDAQEAKRRIESVGLPTPTLLANSGHGVHAYWRLANPLPDIRQWTGQQKAIIAAVDSDPSIHDPPRIMRWIGFPNCKDAEPCVTTIIESNATARYELASFPSPVAEPVRVKMGQIERKQGEYAKLRSMTTEYLAVGCGSGERNARAFAAAAELYGAGYDDSEVRDLIHTANARSRPPMDAAEVDALIESASSKPRTQWVDEDDDGFGKWGVTAELGVGESVTVGTPAPVPKPASPDKPHISNAMIQTKLKDDGEKVTITLAKPIDRILLELSQTTGGWPRKVSGLVFVGDETGNRPLPGPSALRVFSKPDDMFAWMHEVAIVHWASGRGKPAINHKTKAPASVVSKPEFFAYTEQVCRPEYVGVEYLPHYPIVDGIYYAPCKLPTATGDCLKELLDRVNAETPVDRALLFAALLTPGWGGPCGARPAFILTSEFGRGVGKTQTVERFAQIWGGCITISSETEKWDSAKSRLLSDAALPIRCVLIDNMRRKMASADLESMLTAPIIDGHRMYQGQFSRPNRMTFFVTANTPRMSQDLADRAVLVRIGQQQHSGEWATWIERFMADNRPQLLADLLGALAQPKRSEIPRELRDRWASWQAAILELFPNGPDLAKAIKERRPLVDSDADDALEVRSELEAELAERGHDPETEQVKISRQDMAEILERRGLIDKKFSKRGAFTTLNDLCTTGTLRGVLKNHRFNNGRAWIWTGPSYVGRGKGDLFAGVTSIKGRITFGG